MRGNRKWIVTLIKMNLTNYQNRIKIAKILIWVTIAFSIISIILYILNFKFIKNSAKYEVVDYHMLILGVILSGCFLLLYILPLIFTKKLNVLSGWAIAWLVLGSVGLLVFFFSLITSTWYYILIKFINIVLIYIGTIMLIVYCKALNDIELKLIS